MDKREFARRRRRLTQLMGDGVAVLPSAPVSVRNRDVEYPYRQESDFFYLTGFSEPDAVAVLVPGRREGEFLLFCMVGSRASAALSYVSPGCSTVRF